ncbi:TPA: IS1595 family transposase [Vibrio parahaemolyticus]|uniref:IS1595 family transposase n=1 Tax=Vibrio parahaemolyticus TaxID=670 RepID=UPI0011236FC7|nr:IS1595 family transposase [Vibrio parahaemolyticus]EGS6496987.1 IS1595 family transposase [Vibrio parahaemolyticus]ELF4876688.1 IS1595 family transposase [Vibrio parahaemolyticus]MCX8878119.1 IS1595 family transposase [Vibrio parahaemolyticus]TOE15156.1 IS1595 family transposase [Vibrio parahaemolyticus]TOG80436.1 IS1595 family transposase [Vibrio parahaemolyticus]
MGINNLDKILQLIPTLNYADTKRLNNSVKGKLDEDTVGKVIAEREQTVADCPHCHSMSFIKHGVTAKGIQRYRCKDCKKTFCSLTGTPLYKMRKEDKWLAYAALMWDGVSLRRIARHLNINLRTAFFWRHRFLQMPNKSQPTSFTGIIEADEAFLPESFKGCRQMPREPRKRGGGKVPLVPFLVSYQRGDQFTYRVMDRNTKENLSNAIKPLLSDGCCLCTDGNLSYQSIVKSLNINVDHKRIISQDGHVVDGIYHIQHVNGFISHFKEWLDRFRGVGTVYLKHYLAWYIWMRGKGHGEESLWLGAALE